MDKLKLILLAAFGFLYYRESTKNKELEQQKEDIQSALDELLNGDGGDGGMNLNADGYNNPNAEKSDIACTGFFRVGNLVGTKMFRGHLGVILQNTGTISYLIKHIEASAYVFGYKVGFAAEQKKDCNVVLNPGDTVEIRFGNTICAFDDASTLAKLRDAFCAAAGKRLITSIIGGVNLDGICSIDAIIGWTPRNGAGTPQDARYVDKPAVIRYINEAYYG